MHGMQLQFLGPVVGAIVAVWLALWWWSRRSAADKARNAPVVSSPWHTLCRIHGVSNVDALRLNALCRSLGVIDPLLLFVDPRWLEQGARGDHEPGEYARLGHQLFGEVFQARDRK